MCLSVLSVADLEASGVAEGLEWNVTMTMHGHRCGYVKVTEGHPAFGKNYGELEDIKVHGDLTFSEADEPCDKEGSDNGWWFGFDCAHPGDYSPFGSLGILPLFTSDLPDTYGDRGAVLRSKEYVIDQCIKLAKQLNEMS